MSVVVAGAIEREAAAWCWSLAPDDEEYPQQLLDLGEPDGPVLQGVGRRDAIAGLRADAAVTIIGSRRASGYGLRMAERLGAELAQAGVTIVSGMALGIDGAAHRGALAAAGPTIAVLAGGPDVVYPARHRGLYERIAACGAVVSDRPLGAVPRRQDFPARNRIMATLSKVVIVVEAASSSGSLITVEIALQRGREVGAVPGQVGMRGAAGTNERIREGATLVRDASDVLEMLAGVGRTAARRVGPALEAELARALAAVASGATTPDQVSLTAALEGSAAAVALARLELLGYVARDLFGAYAPTGLEPPG